MGVATTTDTTDSVRNSFEMLKNLYGIPVQVVETIKKENEENFGYCVVGVTRAAISVTVGRL